MQQLVDRQTRKIEANQRQEKETKINASITIKDEDIDKYIAVYY